MSTMAHIHDAVNEEVKVNDNGVPSSPDCVAVHIGTTVMFFDSIGDLYLFIDKLKVGADGYGLR